MSKAAIRLTLATVLFSSWLVVLLVGSGLKGAVHLLLAASLLLFPWSKIRSSL